MCSIAGSYWFNDKGNDEGLLNDQVQRAFTMLHKRGPDEFSFVNVRNNCVMGGNRLIIRGSKNDGSLPFKHNKNILYYNGEIYNYQKWNPGASSDGEVILPLYEELGWKAFLELDGEFALSIWDDKKEQLILARDLFGTKPIYFSINNERILWASSASAINEMEKHSFCTSTKGPTYKHSYAVQEPYTSYNGIWLIPPGHFLVVNKNGVQLRCYNLWQEHRSISTDLTEVFLSLEQSLVSRMDYKGVIGIPMSAGIDSGIIAFMADKLGVKYHIFSIIEIMGEKTDESENILKRIDRLRNVSDVTLLKCNEDEYELALEEMFLPQYYDSEKFDNGNILMHTVFNAMNKAGIRVAIDGSGGDELFHGYNFREDFKPLNEWPNLWKQNNYYYSLFTTLLDYTSKSDRAGAYFSIESRYPYQNFKLMKAASKLKSTNVLKWPLREFLLQQVNYGPSLDIDRNGKFGFSIKNRNKEQMIHDMKEAWCRANNLTEMPNLKPKKFPFKIGMII
mgnify:CR=1 FL=1